MRAGFLCIFLILSLFSFAAKSAEVELLYTKQLAWTAANMEDPQVVASFEKSWQKLLADPAQLSQLQTSEGQRLLEQGQRLQGVIHLKENLKKCLLSSSSAQVVSQTLDKALSLKALSDCNCSVAKDPGQKLQNFNQQVQDQMMSDAKNKMLALAQQQLQSTRSYWSKVQKEDSANISADLLNKERNIKTQPPQEGVALLLYTHALQDRKDKNLISKTDVKNAFSEVQNELQTHEDYLHKMGSEKPTEALQDLLITNPAAAAEYLLQNPSSLEMICKILQSYDTQVKRHAIANKVFFWGGLVIGGVLIVSGVGSGLGAAVVSEAVVSGVAVSETVASVTGTLAAVATGTALLGTVTAGGETIYASYQAYDAFNDARELRASIFFDGMASDSSNRANDARHEAYADLAQAGFAAVSIVPFGAGLKILKKMMGSSPSSVQALALLLQKIASHKEVLQSLEKAQKSLSSEDMGSFLGQWSHLPTDEKEKMLTLIEEKPDKVAQAIHESSDSGVCR